MKLTTADKQTIRNSYEYLKIDVTDPDEMFYVGRVNAWLLRLKKIR